MAGGFVVLTPALASGSKGQGNHHANYQRCAKQKCVTHVLAHYLPRFAQLEDKNLNSAT